MPRYVAKLRVSMPNAYAIVIVVPINRAKLSCEA